MDIKRNVRRINRLADFIEQSYDEPFNYIDPAHCIGGYALKLWGAGVSSPIHNSSFCPMKMAELLGLSRETVYELCFTTQMTPYANITRGVAVRVLRHLAETGDVRFE